MIQTNDFIILFPPSTAALDATAVQTYFALIILLFQTSLLLIARPKINESCALLFAFL